MFTVEFCLGDLTLGSEILFATELPEALSVARRRPLAVTADRLGWDGVDRGSFSPLDGPFDDSASSGR